MKNDHHVITDVVNLHFHVLIRECADAMTARLNRVVLRFAAKSLPQLYLDLFRHTFHAGRREHFYNRTTIRL